jgi:hypothetical protein
MRCRPDEAAITSRAASPAGLALALVVAVALLPIVVGAQASVPTVVPELPRAYVDTAVVAPSGRTIAVGAGGNFQAALHAARPGDVITLAAGATFVGPFTLPNKRGSGWIVIRTSAPDSSLPPPGTRIDPSYAGVMPKLVAASGSVIRTAPGARHYRFVGIEIHPAEGVFLYNLVELGVEVPSRTARAVLGRLGLGPRPPSLEELPHHIIVDRCYLHGDPRQGTRRGIALNGRVMAVVDSYLSDFKEVGADSQAIAGWEGPGPFKVVNNYLEGAGENVMFGGGGDPAIPNLVPSDIEIRRNHFFKPLAWKVGDPAHRGTPWAVKNLFELKNARRVLIEGNLFEHNWAHAQAGFAIVLTVRNQYGGSPWAVVEDVTFVNNVVRHIASGVNILGWDDNYPSQQTKRILIKNNLFDDVGGPRWGGGRLFQLLRGAADVVIDHNTAFQTDHILYADGEPSHQGFVFQNNIAPHNDHGVFGSGQRSGLSSLTHYFPAFLFAKNVLVGERYAPIYPADNFFPPSFAAVGFVDQAGGDYRLANTSPYKGAGTDGKDPGVDVDALDAAMAEPP